MTPKIPTTAFTAVCSLVLLLVLASALRPAADAQVASPPADHGAHLTITPDGLRWSSVGPGLSIAVLSGSMQDEGAPFVFRLKVAAGSRIAPHWHPVDEHVTVVSGTFHMGTGDRFDTSAGSTLVAGAYAVMPKTTIHFAWVDTETVLQVHGIGPFKTNFVEPRSQ